MNKERVDLTKLNMPADEFDAMMRRALDAPPPPDEQDKVGKKPTKRPKAGKEKAVERI